MSDYQYIQLWTMPSNYAGEVWPDYYSAGVGRSRDSDALERANFDAMLRRLGGESETVIVVRESHWAVGWVEWIAIHESDLAALSTANATKGALEHYPVISDELYSQYEDEECAEVWSKCMDAKERLEYFRRHGHAKESPACGESHLGCLLKAIKGGDWYYAANLLHCPSDLLA